MDFERTYLYFLKTLDERLLIIGRKTYALVVFFYLFSSLVFYLNHLSFLPRTLPVFGISIPISEKVIHFVGFIVSTITYLNLILTYFYEMTLCERYKKEYLKFIAEIEYSNEEENQNKSEKNGDLNKLKGFLERISQFHYFPSFINNPRIESYLEESSGDGLFSKGALPLNAINHLIVFIFPVIILAFWAQHLWAFIALDANPAWNVRDFIYNLTEYIFLPETIIKIGILLIGTILISKSFENLVILSTKKQEDSVLTSIQDFLRIHFRFFVFVIIAGILILVFYRTINPLVCMGQKKFSCIGCFFVYFIISYSTIIIAEKFSSVASFPQFIRGISVEGLDLNILNKEMISEKQVHEWRRQAWIMFYVVYSFVLSFLISIYVFLMFQGKHSAFICIYSTFIVHFLFRDLALNFYRNRLESKVGKFFVLKTSMMVNLDNHITSNM